MAAAEEGFTSRRPRWLVCLWKAAAAVTARRKSKGRREAVVRAAPAGHQLDSQRSHGRGSQQN